MRYVVDTHSLVWYFVDDSRLSNQVDEIIQQAEQGRNELIIPVIVLLEALDIYEKKRVEFEITKLFEFVESHENFLVLDLTFQAVKEMTELGQGLDLHDRIIYAASQQFNAVILTKDSKIKELAETIW